MGSVLVTGATGFLGGATARELARRGFSVRATGRNREVGKELASEGIEFVPCDLGKNSCAVMRLVEGCEDVVHAAALSAPWGPRSEFVRCNVEATRQILEASKSGGVRRLVHISSPSVSFVFHSQRGLAEDAEWTTPAANHYIATKRKAEVMAKAAGAVILRPRAVFGPGDTTLLPRLIRVAKRGDFPLFGEEDPLLDLTWIGDAVEGVRLALEAPDACRGRVYHITSGAALPRSEVLETLWRACGLSVRYRSIPVHRALAIGGALEAASQCLSLGLWEPPLTRYAVGVLAFEQTLDISAARRDLGYLPRADLRAALAQCGDKWRKETTRK